MAITLIRMFDELEPAIAARAALLDAGLAAGDVVLNITNDEAGGVEGNFTVGNLPMESPQHTYDRNYARMQRRAQCIATIAAPDEAAAAMADAILIRFGARNGDPAADGHGATQPG